MVRATTVGGAFRWMMLAGCVAAAMPAVGCGGDKTMKIDNDVEFRQMVLEAKQPALVDFYKGGCPTCAPLDPVFDDLTEEYQGRAVIAKFMAITPSFGVPYPEIKEKYVTVMVPTVVLFVDGQETKRWVMNYNIGEYRKALNEALAARGTPPAQ